MFPSRFVPRLAGIVAIAAALAGCAVTKIDVDVYKGPLANQKEVQLERMAVMAIGAKPILMQLRDRLERTKREDLIAFGQPKPKPIREAFGDRYGTCIREDKDTEEEEEEEKKKLVKFKSDDARHVNAILCLYEDRHLDDLRTLQSRARAALRAYRKAWRNFQGENRNWEAFTSAIYPELIAKAKGSKSQSLPEGHPLKAACSKKEKKCYNAVVKLSKVYGQLLNKDGPERSAAQSIWKAHKGIFKLDLWPAQHRLHSLMNRFAEEYKGANWTYRFLSDKRMVEAHATLLFKEKSNKKKEFVQSVTLIAESFRSARAALRALLQINLDSLDTFVRRSDSESVQNFRQRSDLAQSIFHLIGWINVRAIVKSVQEKPNLFSQKLREFASRAATNKGVLSGFREDFPDFEAFLLSELTRNSLETTSALREADRELSYPSLPTGEYKTLVLEQLKPAARREFGLARVIQQEEDSQILFTASDLEHVEKPQKEKLGGTATGLDNGRLDDGLESMIEKYLEQNGLHKMNDRRDVSPETRRLRDALVRFAQKILFVANYDNLLSGDNQKKILLEYAWDYTGGFVTQHLFKDDERVREYTQVLQAVGNSILNQADELQARETHKDSLEKGVGRARYGISRVLDRTPQQTVAAITDKFEAERVDASNSLKAATVEVKKADTEFRAEAKKLNPYVEQNLQPSDENSSLPKPSDLVVKANGPLKAKKEDVTGAENTLCEAFTKHAINVLSARLTLTDVQTSDDQRLYKNIRDYKPSKGCNPLDKAQKLLKGHGWPRNLLHEMESHAKRVLTEINDWKPKDNADNDLQQNASAFLEKIIKFLRNLQKEIFDKEDPDYIKLEQVIVYLSKLELNAIKPGEPLDVFKQIQNNLIGAQWQRVAENLSDDFQSLKRAQEELKKEQDTFKRLKAYYRDKYEAWTQADKKQEALTARVNALKTAVEEINGLKAAVVAKTLSANLPNDPSATFLLLKTTVADKLKMAKNAMSTAPGEDKSSKEIIVGKWQTTWNELDNMNPPMSAKTIGQNDFKKDKNSREVLDRLISVLEYERIEAIKQGGMEGRAKNIADALREAYKSRTQLAFIRPASSYLRSSNPAASLQNDPGLGWRNELARHSFKSIPVFGGMITHWLDKRDSPDINLKVLSQIDRQFWQNINSIRVGGAGYTNYVMVQDDIGNWYVKGYSADAKNIAKSAKGLGLFALSRQLGTDLVNRPAPGTGSAPTLQPTALETVFDKHKTEYERATAETFEEVKSTLEENGQPSENYLPLEVQKAWNEDSRTEKVRTEAVAQLPGAKVHLKEALNELKKDDDNKPEQVAQRPSRIVAALRAIDRYRDQLEDSINKNVPKERPNGNAGTKAERITAINAVITDLNVVVNAKIERFLKRREDTAKVYENAIMFAGEVVSQAPAPPEETSTPQDNEVVE